MQQVVRKQGKIHVPADWLLSKRFWCVCKIKTKSGKIRLWSMSSDEASHMRCSEWLTSVRFMRTINLQASPEGITPELSTFHCCS